MENEAGTVIASAAWTDATSLVGREFVSKWLQLDDAHIDQFESGTYLLENTHEMNVGGYPSGLVEGFHLLALLDYLCNGVSFIEDPRWVGWNYGLDRVRFVSPVTTSDRLRARGAVESVTPRGDDLLVKYDVWLEVDGREKPAMVAQWLVLWSIYEGEPTA